MFKRIFSSKTKVYTFIFSDAFFLVVLSLFIFINWLLMTGNDILACNDYYKYYFAQETLFSGNLNLEFIPPLFPFLLGLFGRFLKLFGGNTDPFILGGQIISLLAGFGVLYFSFKLLKKHTAGLSVIGTIFLAISPFYLKLLSTAQTDMLYLFFAVALFYFLSVEKKVLPALGFTLAGLLTRFEGVLLIGSCLINYFNLKRKTWRYLLLSALPAGLVLYILFDRFAHRLIDKIGLIISKGYYFYYFTHPGELVHLLYGNLLYFVPARFPSLIKWLLFYVLVALFIVGFYYLFKTKRQWVLSVSFYMIVFVLAKGYTQALHPEMEFRRWLSIIWLFFIIALAGASFLWHKIKEREKINIPIKLALILFFLLVALFLPVIKGKSILLALFLIPPLLYGITRKSKNIGKLEFAGWFLILAVFFSQVYYDGLKRTFSYLNKDSNAGSYMIANWINGRPVEEKILVYSYWPMFYYYVEKDRRRDMIFFEDKEIYSNREKLLAEFMNALKKKKIRYIAFDGYQSPTYKAINAINDLLYQERDKGVYFRVKKHLFYKGKYVASVLMPK